MTKEEALQQPAPTYSPKPADDYANLRKQFLALLNITNSLEEQLKFYRQQDYDLSKERLTALEKAIESEKVMNAKLTSELEALEQPSQKSYAQSWDDTHPKQSAQEPVMYMPSKFNNLTMVREDGTPAVSMKKSELFNTALYTHSIQPLSDDEIGELFIKHEMYKIMAVASDDEKIYNFIRAIEAAHGIGDKE